MESEQDSDDLRDLLLKVSNEEGFDGTWGEVGPQEKQKRKKSKKGKKQKSG